MANRAEEDYIKRMHWDGGINPPKGSDYSSVVEQNVGGNKLNYFEQRNLSLDVRIQGRNALDTSKASIFNGVTMPQPRWSMGDSGPFHHPMLNFYAPERARLTRAKGPPLGTSGDPVSRPARIGSPPNLSWTGTDPPEHLELGTKVWTGTLDIPPLQTGSLEVTYEVPGVVKASGNRMMYKLMLRQQPGVHAASQTVTLHLPSAAHAVSAPGFKHEGGVWVWHHVLDTDTPLSVSWKASG
jgi:hypothetical protein